MSAFYSLLLKTVVFFRRQQWKEIFIFLFFLLLSLAFWLLQTLQQDYEQRFDIPLRYKNVPAEWVLSENNPTAIRVLLKEKGTNILYYYWNARFHSIDVNVTGLPQLSDSSRQITNKMLESEVSKLFLTSTSITSFEPREITLLYDTLSSCVKPVTAHVNITTRAGFQVSDSITVSPSEALLYGSSKVLETLKEVKTKLITLEDVSKTIERMVKLDLPAGVKSEQETVKLTIPVEEFTEKKIQLPVQCLDIPANYVLRLFPSSVEITCHLPLSQFRDLTEEMLDIVIPFTEFEDNQATGKIPVRLTRKPAWVTTPVIVPSELEFIIEHHD